MPFKFTSALPAIRNWLAPLNKRFQQLDEGIQSIQGQISNIPGPGVQLVTFADTDATLGVAGGLWELRVVKANANRYVWDPDNDWWLLCPGNRYAAAGGIPADAHPMAGDMALIANEAVYHNGDQWLPPEITGMFVPALFEPHPTDSDKIRITGGRYHVAGFGWVFNPGVIDYSLTSLAEWEWRYCYITATVPGEITAANITDSQTPWSADHVKGGQYNGDNRGIFAVYGTGSASYKKFTQTAGFVCFNSHEILLNGFSGTAGESQAVTTIAPANSPAVRSHYRANYNSMNDTLCVMGSVDDRLLAMQVRAASERADAIADVGLDGASIYYQRDSGDCGGFIRQIGYHLPWRL